MLTSPRTRGAPARPASAADLPEAGDGAPQAVGSATDLEETAADPAISAAASYRSAPVIAPEAAVLARRGAAYDGAEAAPPPASGARMTRREAAEVLGVSVRSVARRERSGMLRATRGEDGRMWLDRAEVEGLRAAQVVTVPAPGVGPAAPHDPPGAGAHRDPVAAAVFGALNAGRSPCHVVADLELAPDVVQRLHSAWLQLSGVVAVDRTARDAVARRLGADDRRWAERLDLLVDGYRRGVADAARWTYPCCRCRGEILARPDLEWAALREGGALASWGHAECLEGE